MSTVWYYYKNNDVLWQSSIHLLRSKREGRVSITSKSDTSKSPLPTNYLYSFVPRLESVAHWFAMSMAERQRLACQFGATTHWYSYQRTIGLSELLKTLALNDIHLYVFLKCVVCIFRNIFFTNKTKVYFFIWIYLCFIFYNFYMSPALSMTVIQTKIHLDKKMVKKMTRLQIL